MEFIKIKYCDEGSIVDIQYSISDFLTLTSKDVIFTHNGKNYVLGGKNINMDEREKSIFLMLEVKK